MYRAVGWQYGKRVLNYACDFEFNVGWSTAPTYEEKQQLTDPDWHPTPDQVEAAGIPARSDDRNVH